MQQLYSNLSVSQHLFNLTRKLLNKREIMQVLDAQATIWASGIMNHRGEPTTTNFIDQHNHLLYSKTFLYPQINIAPIPHQRNFLVQKLDITKNKMVILSKRSTDYGEPDPTNTSTIRINFNHTLKNLSMDCIPKQ